MKKLDNGRFACDICGKDFEKEGWCRQHETGAHKASNVELTEGKKAEKSENNKCPECGTTLRLLKSSDMYERKAITLGYKKICPKCEELIK